MLDSTRTQTHTGTHTSAVVVGEVVRAGLLGHRGRSFRDGDVLKVEEAELHLHADQSVQIAARQVAAHLSAQQCAQPVGPDAVLQRTRAPHRCTNAGNETRKAPRLFFSILIFEFENQTAMLPAAFAPLIQLDLPVKNGAAYLVLVGRNKIERLIWIIEYREGQLQHLLKETKQRGHSVVKQRRFGNSKSYRRFPQWTMLIKHR